MMKIICLVFLVGIFAIESEAWRKRRIRLRRIRIRVPKPNKIFDKATDAFKSAYNKVCGGRKKRDCDDDLLKRVQVVCDEQSCLKRNFNFAKRSIDSKEFNEQPLVNDNMAVSEMSQSKRSVSYARLVVKGGVIYNKCCLNACRDVEIVERCIK